MTAIPIAPRASLYDVLCYAADQFATGSEQGGWRWHRGDGTDDLAQWRDCSCILTGICRAARECDAFQTAYDGVKHVEWYVGGALGPWNDTKGRTLEEVVDALRGAALLSP